MRVDRMRRLARYLKRVPRRGFYMGSFVSRSDSSVSHAAALIEASRNEFRCGTTACVVGHMALLFPDEIRMREGIPVLKIGGGEAFQVAEEVLGLCEKHAARLCSGQARHRTPKAAASFVERLIRMRPDCCGGRTRCRTT